MRLLICMASLLMLGSCSDASFDDKYSNNSTPQTSLLTRGTGDDYYYTQLGVSVKNSGIGPETWYGAANYFTPRAVTYTEEADYNTVANALLRVPWAAVEDENGYHFEKAFDNCFLAAYNNKQKVCLGVFPLDSWTSDIVKISAPYKNRTRTAYLNYPEYIHNMLMKSDKYKPRMYQNLYDGSIKDDDEPVYFSPDLRNPLLYKKYCELMKAFSDFLDKKVEIDGRTITRRMLVREIQIRHWGWYGEGLYRYIVPIPENVTIKSDEDEHFDMEKSADLIKWGNIYKTYFPDIRLIAPSNGLWVHEAWSEYQHWLLTDSNDVGEFGLFCDVWGEKKDNTAMGDTYSSWNGKKLRPIALNKWRKAPIGGETYTYIPQGNFIPYSSIVDQVKLVRPAKILEGNYTYGNEPGNTTHWAATEREFNLIRESYSLMGFRIIANEPSYRQLNNKQTEMTFYMQNIGLTPVYEPWDINYVFRNKFNQKEVAIRKSSYDIRKLMPAEDAEQALQVRYNGWHKIVDTIPNVTRGTYKVYLRISDPDDIVPNMKLSQPGYDKNGEYQFGWVTIK